MKRRLLLIAHHFPPYGGPRSRRWVRLVRHTAPFIDYDVLTVRHERGVGAYEDPDGESMPGNVKVHRTYPGPLYALSYRSLPPAKAGESPGPGGAALRNAVRTLFRGGLETFLVPDKTVEWLLWGYPAARKLVKAGDYDAVVSSASPLSDHVLAYLIKKKTGLPWIADFGDPWAFNDALPFRARRRVLDRRLEAVLLDRMDAVVVTTPETEEGYLSHYPSLGPDRTFVLPNGCDEEELAGLATERGDRFRLVYTGIFYKSRGPEVLFEALARIDLDLELVIAGDVPGQLVRKAEKLGLAGKVKFLGHCPHRRSLSLQKGADVLLLLGWAGGWQVPAKVYEYMCARRPILAIRFDDDDLGARMVESRGLGPVVRNNVEDIAPAVRELHGLWKRGALDSRFKPGALEEYSVGVQAGRFMGLVEKVLKGRA